MITIQMKIGTNIRQFKNFILVAKRTSRYWLSVNIYLQNLRLFLQVFQLLKPQYLNTWILTLAHSNRTTPFNYKSVLISVVISYTRRFPFSAPDDTKITCAIFILYNMLLDSVSNRNQFQLSDIIIDADYNYYLYLIIITICASRFLFQKRTFQLTTAILFALSSKSQLTSIYSRT